MAEVLIYRIEFIANNPPSYNVYSNYVAGDLLEIYIETTAIAINTNINAPSTTGVRVYKNGIQIYTPQDQIITAVNFISLQYSGPQICTNGAGDSGTYLFSPSLYGQFPYVTYITLPDAQQCSITTPVACDLLVVGTPVVVKASTSTAADGQITITATSSNTIEYKIGSDFIYGDGSGQATGNFTGLAQGFYRIFLRDSKNCSANVYVEVEFTSTYGILYQLTYYDFAGFQTKIDILERDFAGAITEVCGSDSPIQIQLRGEGGNDKFESLLPIQANISLVSETDQQFIDLYTNDPDKYRVKYYKDLGSGYVLKAVTKLLPFVYQEDYAATPYIINVSATDGLADLKDFPFIQKDGLPFYGKMKLIKIIAHCLSFTNLDLPIKVACNLYSTGMTTTAASDPLDQAYVDVECFYLADRSAKLSFVLESILKPFGARLIQWDGYWNIVRAEELNVSYDYRVFDSTGTYVSNSSFDPVLDVHFPGDTGDVMFTGIPNLELQNGYGKVTVKYNLGLSKNILKNGDFQLVSRYDTLSDEYIPVLNKEGWLLVNGSYALQEGYEVIDDGNVAYALYNPSQTVQGLGEAYFLSDVYSLKMGVANSVKISVRLKVDAPNQYPPPYIKVRIMVKYGSLYLLGDGSWSNTENILTFFASKLNEYEDYEIIGFQPTTGTPVDGMDFSVRVYHAHAYYTDYNNITTLKALDTVGLPDQFRITYKDSAATSTSGDYVNYYELLPNTETESLNNLIQPDDYGAGNGYRKWVLVDYMAINSPEANFALDFVKVQFLYNGADPIDTIVRSTVAEANNKITYDETLIIGSSAEFITTEGNVYTNYGRILYGEAPRVNLIRTNVLSYGLVYKGWLQNSSGVSFDDWTRDGVGELEKLHNIWLKSFVNQYKRSWRMLRANMVSQTTYMSPLNSFKELNDSNRIYIPISMILDDRANTASCELLELIATDSGGGIAPYSSGFTTGFGQDFD